MFCGLNLSLQTILSTEESWWLIIGEAPDGVGIKHPSGDVVANQQEAFSQVALLFGLFCQCCRLSLEFSNLLEFPFCFEGVDLHPQSFGFRAQFQNVGLDASNLPDKLKLKGKHWRIGIAVYHAQPLSEFVTPMSVEFRWRFEKVLDVCVDDHAAGNVSTSLEPEATIW